MRELVIRTLLILAGLAGVWYFYVKILMVRILDRHWGKPTWVNRILVFGTPIAFGVGAGLLFRSRIVGVLFLTPLVFPLGLILGFLILWGCEQWTIRQMLRQER